MPLLTQRHSQGPYSNEGQSALGHIVNLEQQARLEQQVAPGDVQAFATEEADVLGMAASLPAEEPSPVPNGQRPGKQANSSHKRKSK